jgi:DNA-binding transcriptional regulator PaaX
MDSISVTIRWRLTAQEAAHAMPVLQAAHPGLQVAPAPKLALIRHLADRSAIHEGTLRTALSRACSSGSLELADGHYRLGPASKEEAAAARALQNRKPGYTLAVILEGEGNDLARLRDLLTRYGFRPLQRSMWIGARTKDDRLGPVLQSAGLHNAAIVFHTDEIDHDARARLSNLWGLDERAAVLRNFHRDLIAHLTEPNITAREAAWRCVEAAPIWYRVALQEEPPFPLDLCGPDYPLDALNAVWRAHLEAMTDALIELWQSEEK